MVGVGDGLDRLAGKARPEHRALLHEPALVGLERVEARGDEGGQPRWDLELAELADEVESARRPSFSRTPLSSRPRTVSIAYSGMPSARSTMRARAIAGRPGDEAVQELADDLVRERVERAGS